MTETSGLGPAMMRHISWERLSEYECHESLKSYTNQRIVNRVYSIFWTNVTLFLWNIQIQESSVVGNKDKTFNAVHFPWYYIFLGGARQPPVDQTLLIHEVSRSHTTTLHSR